MSKNKFDEEAQKKALRWLDKKWPIERRGCEVCGAQHWFISTDFTTPVVFDGGFYLGGRAYPTVGVICQNCGNTKYFNAVKMSLIEETRADQHNE